MPFAGGMKGFGDDTTKKPKAARSDSMPSYNTAMRKKRRHKKGHMGKAHGMRPRGFDRVKGS